VPRVQPRLTSRRQGQPHEALNARMRRYGGRTQTDQVVYPNDDGMDADLGRMARGERSTGHTAIHQGAGTPVGRTRQTSEMRLLGTGKW